MSGQITLFVAASFLVGLGLIAWWSTPRAEATATRAEPIPVIARPAHLEDGYTVRRSFVGRVEARRESRVGFELAGKIERVRVDEGDTVAAGELLAELDTDRLLARQKELEAALAQAEADLRLAGATLERTREAQVLDAVSSQALDEAALGLEARRAARARAAAAVEQIEVELRKSRLLSPYDALVTGRFVDEGQVVSTGTPVLHLLEKGRPRARVGVAGDSVHALAEGQGRWVEIDGRRIGATVEAILPSRQSETRAVEVLLGLDASLAAGPSDGSGAVVRSGDLVRLGVERFEPTRGFWLPTAALTESRRGLWAAYVVIGDGDTGRDGLTAERRELEVLHQEAERVFARGTLGDGETVVRSGLHRLVPGQQVRLVSDDGEPIEGVPADGPIEGEERP
ncbi:MAG: efflux RND transporter periplasmic adaptor subunit [Holophagales bacterium]|nr:efflux RND transporter periplasmic adaptor subunit [Holophagales bacterium]